MAQSSHWGSMKTIAIDPDLRKSGVALVIDGKLAELHSLPFVDVLPYLQMHSEPANLLVKIENPAAISAMWSQRNKMSLAAKMSVAQDVGRVMAVAELLQQVIENAGYKVKMIKPLSGPVKRAKDDAEYFNRLTGWTGRSNQDKRDAALIALYG